MSNAMDDLLTTVSSGDIDHPVFGDRYAGDMDDEEFISAVEDYIWELRDEIARLEASIKDMN